MPPPFRHCERERGNLVAEGIGSRLRGSDGSTSFPTLIGIERGLPRRGTR